MNFVSTAELARDVLSLVPFCVERKVSAIYGVPRSGMIPASMLATALQLPLGMATVDGATAAGRRVVARPRQASGPALLLDDSYNHGWSMRTAAEAMGGLPLRACVYMLPGKESEVDAFARRIDGPRLFEWNLFNCDQTAFIMFDLDGVFADDPTVFDDDGPAYQAAIRDAAPRRLSTFPIGWITTNRIERWRGLTETWLARHGIQIVHALRMQPYSTAAARRKKSPAAKFKADIYRAQAGARLFVESSDAQAREIYRVTKKPVLSIETMRMYK